MSKCLLLDPAMGIQASWKGVRGREQRLDFRGLQGFLKEGWNFLSSPCSQARSGLGEPRGVKACSLAQVATRCSPRV